MPPVSFARQYIKNLRVNLGTFLARDFQMKSGMKYLIEAFCLGMFMPLGLEGVTALTSHSEEYVAWAWAVNGFFSVAGASLASIGALWLGFRWTVVIGAALYVMAGLLFQRVGRGIRSFRVA